MVIAPRRFFLAPFILAACFMSMDERLDILGLDFTVLRFLILAGLLRLTIRGEVRSIQWNTFDKLIFTWAIAGSLIYIVNYATPQAFIYKSGVIFDCLGIYWLTRQALGEWSDVHQAIKILGFFAIVTAPLIALVTFHDLNIFSIFGGKGGMYHRGRFRALGSFPHAIMLGCFWATLLPLFYSEIKANKGKIFYILALSAAISNVLFSASSTPLMTVLASIIFWNIYSYRMYGRMIFNSICAGLFILHLIMKAPVWHLIARVDIFSGSTGWHRYNLFDKFIKNYPDWFLTGTENTDKWGTGLGDITNQFVLEGVRGGVVTLLLFIIIIFRAVKIPGRMSLISTNKEVKLISWGICISVLSHFVSFWGVSYFGQINMLFYLTLALVAFTLEKSSEISI